MDPLDHLFHHNNNLMKHLKIILSWAVKKQFRQVYVM